MDPTETQDDNLFSGTDVSLLRRIEAVATASSDRLFASLVSQLTEILEADCAVVAEIVGDARVRALALREPQGVRSGLEWDLAGSACADLVDDRPRHCDSAARERFPGDQLIVEREIESHLGVALAAPDGQRLGYLCALGTKPMALGAEKLSAFRILAAQAAAELARLRIERTLGESEERFRDLFDEAPIAYVHEDLDSRFIRANRAALRILGVRPEEAVGTIGISLAPDTPDAQRRIQAAFASIGRGTDTSGVVLELRRKDNGKPIWIQWWSKPDPSGTYTRTMFVDITDRVLLEQEQGRLKEQNRYLREEIKSVHNFEAIVGASQGLLALLEKVGLVAETDATVLISGETGTGKELIARAIHSTSPRHDKPLIKLNCAALPTGLVESELFGHERGAFSGANERRIGRFELAHGGTIFLDEIGEMPLDVQVKLLRVLQEREFERVGGNAQIKVDVRVIAATNRALPQAVAEGRFREDLFYRLNVFPLQMPPLRERVQDIPLLAHHFVRRFVAQIGRQIGWIPDEVLERLCRYSWPGNIRELENVIERAVILSPGEDLVIGPEMLVSLAAEPTSAAERDDRSPALVAAAEEASRERPSLAERDGDPRVLEDFQRTHIVEVLRRTDWRIEGPKGAAAALGMNPSTLRSRMKKLQIRRSEESS